MSKCILTKPEFKRHGIAKSYEACFHIRKKSVTVGKDGNRYLIGYAGTIGKDRVADNIVIEAWKKAKDDLMKAGARTVFYNHDTNIAIGRVVETTVDDVGLLVKILISKAKDVSSYWTKIKEGVLNALSIRLRPKKIQKVEDEQSGRVLEYKILDMELFEVSVVGIPAQPRATINSVIGKSFGRAINHYNRRSEMHKKQKTTKMKKATLTIEEQIGSSEVIKQLAAGQAMIAKALKGLGAQMADLKNRTQTAEEKAAVELKKMKEQKRALKKAASKDSTLALLAQSVLDLRKQMGGNGARKGTEAAQGGEEGNGLPKKALKSADDEATVKYVLYLMEEDNNGHPVNAAGKAAYAVLSKEEQAVAKGIYGQLLMAALERE